MTNSRSISKANSESKQSAGSTGERKSRRLLDIANKGGK